MCGIVGLYLKQRDVLRTEIDAMNEVIVHRGPDGEGVFCEGRVGLGMRRLSIIDLEGGGQPIGNETGRIQVVQNGELYNYRELRGELEGRGHVFRTQSDTEVAVHAYEEWGGFEFAQRLRGMFAIAVWDSERGELWLARDRIGIKPLYYAETGAGFCFGSEVKSLLRSPIVRRELEPAALAQYLTYGSAGAQDSFIRGVRQLLPGHALRHDGERSETRPYWSFRFPEPERIGEQEAIERVRERLRETVRTHLVADVPVGAFLSGGVDSSAIVALMAQEGATGFKTFSIGFEEERFNELPYARLVAERYGTEHHEEIVRPDAVSIVDDLCWHLDEPFADASAVPTWYVAQMAAREVKVVLTGDGGDELFAGYNRYAWAARDGWLDSVPRPLRRLCAAGATLLPQSFPGKYFADYASYDRRGRYIYNFELFPPPLRRRLLRRAWQPAQLGLQDPREEWRRVMQESGAPDPMSERMHLDLKRYLPMDILVKVDRTTMAHSLEARPPLLDHEFVEFAASLPLELKYAADGTRKHVLKQAVQPLVPPELLTRPKSGFSVPLQDWFRGPLRPMFEDQVLHAGRCLEYLRPRVLRQLLDENARGRRDHGIKLWAVLVLEIWMRRNLGA